MIKVRTLSNMSCWWRLWHWHLPPFSWLAAEAFPAFGPLATANSSRRKRAQAKYSGLPAQALRPHYTRLAVGSSLICVYLCSSVANNFLLVFLILRRCTEGNGGFPGVLVIVSEIDHVARAIRCAALAAQRLRMHRQQVLLGIAQADVLIIRSRFHVVQRKLRGQSLSFHLNA